MAETLGSAFCLEAGDKNEFTTFSTGGAVAAYGSGSPYPSSGPYASYSIDNYCLRLGDNTTQQVCRTAKATVSNGVVGYALVRFDNDNATGDMEFLRFHDATDTMQGALKRDGTSVHIVEADGTASSSSVTVPSNETWLFALYWEKSNSATAKLWADEFDDTSTAALTLRVSHTGDFDTGGSNSCYMEVCGNDGALGTPHNVFVDSGCWYYDLASSADVHLGWYLYNWKYLPDVADQTDDVGSTDLTTGNWDDLDGGATEIGWTYVGNATYSAWARCDGATHDGPSGGTYTALDSCGGATIWGQDSNNGNWAIAVGKWNSTDGNTLGSFSASMGSVDQLHSFGPDGAVPQSGDTALYGFKATNFRFGSFPFVITSVGRIDDGWITLWRRRDPIATGGTKLVNAGILPQRLTGGILS